MKSFQNELQHRRFNDEYEQHLKHKGYLYRTKLQDEVQKLLDLPLDEVSKILPVRYELWEAEYDTSYANCIVHKFTDEIRKQRMMLEDARA